MKSELRTQSSSRRNFLKGNFTNLVHRVRPPWSITEHLFLECCTRCNDCINACPEHLLIQAEDHYPQASFVKAGCTYCAECLEACKTGALQGLRTDIDQAWQHVMRVNDNCLSVKGVVCRACGDHCDARAIGFTLLTGGRSLPEINPAACNGCGQCIPSCPADAITIHDNLEVA